MAKELTKKAAPKQTEISAPVEKETAKNLGPAPKPSMQQKSDKDIVAENKAIRKAEKSAKKDEKVLHFSVIKFVANLLFFIASTIVLVIGVEVLLNHGGSTGNPEIEVDIMLLINLVLILAFAIWISVFQLGYRRVFGIGKYERMRKAIEKKNKQK